MLGLMANHKSAKKRSIQNKLRNAINSKYISRIRTALNKFNNAIKLKKNEEIQKTFSSVNSILAKSVKKGIFAVSFGGGQVDITSGKFVFNCTEAYEIINGKVCSPIKGATLIGDGPSALKEVSMVGNDMMLDPGIGTCGKAGQGVPVGVGQPSLLINKMTVGGTQL